MAASEVVAVGRTGNSGSPVALASRVPDPGTHNLHDQPLPGTHALARGKSARGVYGDVGHPRHPGMGRGLVGYASHLRRPDRQHHRCAPGGVSPCIRTSRSRRPSCAPASTGAVTRNRLVTDGLNFPSNDYIYHGLARQGAEVVSVPSSDGMTVPLERNPGGD